jgi:hypothetical protein
VLCGEQPAQATFAALTSTVRVFLSQEYRMSSLSLLASNTTGGTLASRFSLKTPCALG